MDGAGANPTGTTASTPCRGWCHGNRSQTRHHAATNVPASTTENSRHHSHGTGHRWVIRHTNCILVQMGVRGAPPFPTDREEGPQRHVSQTMLVVAIAAAMRCQVERWRSAAVIGENERVVSERGVNGGLGSEGRGGRVMSIVMSCLVCHASPGVHVRSTHGSLEPGSGEMDYSTDPPQFGPGLLSGFV